MWSGLRPGCGQLKSEPVMHICALFYLILHRYAQRAINKAQFHLVPISLTENSPPSLCLPLSPCVETHLDTHRHAFQRMQRYRSYIEVAFQRSPHGVDDRVYLKEKRHAAGDLKSEEDIRKIHWKKSPLAILFFFFTFRNNFVPFPQREKCSVERGQKEGRDAVFWVGLKCKGCNENQLAGRHYLSIVVQECIDMERKNRPAPNPLKPSLFSSSPHSPWVSFRIENSSHSK